VLLVGSAMISFLGIVAVLMQNVLSPFLIFINNLFYGLNDVAKEHLQQEDFDARQRATMSSLSQFMGSSIAAVISFCMGIIADMSGIATTLLIFMVLRLPVVGMYWVLFRKKMA
jgi:fucose permease